MRSQMEDRKAIDRIAPVSGPGFLTEAAAILAPLRGARIPLTLMSLSANLVGRSELYRAAQQALGIQGLVEWLPDGSVGFLYIGPHARPSDLGGSLTARVFRDLAARLVAEFPGRRMDLAIRCVNFLSDEVSDPGQIVEALGRPEATDLYCPDIALPGVLYGFTQEDRLSSGSRLRMRYLA